MKQTWRWFGPADTVSIDELLQVGVQGVVSALHHIRPGAIWSVEAIEFRQQQIATLSDGSPSQLEWAVVESLPVSESIKTQSGDWLEHVEAYKTSLQNLAGCGLKTVCYNFMPILDWTRTTLRSPMAHGGFAMRFDLVDFAVFDLYLLKRLGAEPDYPDDVRAIAEQRFHELCDEQKQALINNIVAGLPGANDAWSLEEVRALLATYDDIDASQLRSNLVAFLEMVVPVAQDCRINLCCHPDDPPFSLLGLPRVVSGVKDYAKIMRAVDLPQNGITLCTGSLGVSPSIDFVKMINDWGERIHFVHLRNTKRQGPSFDNKHSFFESDHLNGDTDMVAVVEALIGEEERRRNEGLTYWEIPMRPDHGQELLSDIVSDSMPGYPLIGRMRGLAELRGIMAAFEKSAGSKSGS